MATAVVAANAANAFWWRQYKLVPKERATNDQNLGVGWCCVLVASLDAVGCL